MADESIDPGQPGAVDDATAAHELANKGPFTPDQLRELAQQEVNAGRLSLEDANASLQADGAEPLDGPPAEPSSSPTAAEAMNMALPPAEPHHFDLGPIDDDPGAAEHDTNVRSWLYTGLFDRGTGSFVGKEAARVAAQMADANDADFELFRNQQENQLARLYGDRAPEMIQRAQKLVDEIESYRPGLKQWLTETGAGNSALVIAQFAAQAQRLAARNG